MESLYKYIYESINHLKNGITGIIVFDIDDTLLRCDMNDIKIIKHPNGDMSKSIILTTDQYAKDKDAGVPSKLKWFDLSDFKNPKKVYKSIIDGTPIIKNLKIMDSYLNAGWDFSFLTARSCENVVKDALNDFLLVRDKNGNLKKLGDKFKKTLSHAVNDQIKTYHGINDSEKKSNILKELSLKYDKIIFVDDDQKNIDAANDLKLKNLKTIKVSS